MSLLDPRPFRRRRDGTFTVSLDDPHRLLIGDLLGQLRELLSTDSVALVRLFPPPYGDDEERNRGYAALAGAELVERRLAALGVVEESLQAERLTEAQLESWMRAINDVRLVLGTILDVRDDGEEPGVAIDEDTEPMLATYEYLGYLLERIVGALSG